MAIKDVSVGIKIDVEKVQGELDKLKGLINETFKTFNVNSVADLDNLVKQAKEALRIKQETLKEGGKADKEASKERRRVAKEELAADKDAKREELAVQKAFLKQMSDTNKSYTKDGYKYDEYKLEWIKPGQTERDRKNIKAHYSVLQQEMSAGQKGLVAQMEAENRRLTQEGRVFVPWQKNVKKEWFDPGTQALMETMKPRSGEWGGQWKAYTMPADVRQQMIAHYREEADAANRAAKEKEKIDQANRKVASSAKKVIDTNKDMRSGFLHLGTGLRGYIEDVKKLLQVQVRWYAARPISQFLVTAVPTATQQGIEYTTMLDDWHAKLLRWGATGGKVTDEMRHGVKLLVQDIRLATLTTPASFQKTAEAAEGFIGAGIDVNTVRALSRELAILKASFPDINMEQFGISITGMFNVFRDDIKGATDDAGKLKILMEQLLKAQAVGIIRPEHFTKVAQYMSEVGHIAGLTTEQIFAMAVTISDTGVKASSASRLIASFLMRLGDERVQKVLEQVGIRLDKNKTIAEQMDKVFVGLRDKLAVGGETRLGALTILEKISGKEPAKAMLPMIERWESFIKLTGQMKGISGVWDELSKLRADTIQGQWGMLKETLRNIASEAGASADTLKVITSGALELARAFLFALTPSLATEKNLANLGGAGKTAYLAFKTLFDAVRLLIDAMAPLGRAISSVNDFLTKNYELVVAFGAYATGTLITKAMAPLVVALVAKKKALDGVIWGVKALMGMQWSWWLLNAKTALAGILSMNFKAWALGAMSGLQSLVTFLGGPAVVAIGAVTAALALFLKGLRDLEELENKDFINFDATTLKTEKQARKFIELEKEQLEAMKRNRDEYANSLKSTLSTMDSGGGEIELSNGGVFNRLDIMDRDIRQRVETIKKAELQLAQIRKAARDEQTKKKTPPPIPEIDTKEIGNLRKTWAKLKEDMRLDVDKIGFTELEQKLLELQHKAKEKAIQAGAEQVEILKDGTIKAKTEKLAGVTAEINKWLAAMSAKTIDEEKMKGIDEAGKGRVEQMKNEMQAVKDYEEYIAGASRNELEKRLTDIHREADEKIAAIRRVYVTELSTEADLAKFEEMRDAINEARDQRKVQAKIEAAKTIKEAEISLKLARIERYRVERIMSPQEALRAEIALREELLEKERAHLETMQKKGNETGWYAQARAIADLESKLLDLRIKLRDFTHDTGGAFSEGLKRYAENNGQMFKNLADSAEKMAQGMESSLSTFLDSSSDKFMDWGNLVISILNQIERELMQAMVIKPFMSQMSTAAAGFFKPEVFGFHSGGEVIPRLHTGGLRSDERLTINKVGERYITAEQNEWLTAQAGQGKNMNVVINIQTSPGMPAVQARETSRSFNGLDTYVVGIMLEQVSGRGSDFEQRIRQMR